MWCEVAGPDLQTVRSLFFLLFLLLNLKSFLAAVLVFLSVSFRALVHVLERVSVLDRQLCGVHHGQLALDGVQPRLVIRRICCFPGRVVLTGFMSASQYLRNDRRE